ncbi:MAG TPA: hypothetical protein VFJ17_13515 [Mycobacteriales bacterium]|nr:hypothetical protein [Mycobacteriales bacterium]
MARDDVLVVAGHAALLLLGAALGVWGLFLVPLRLPGGVEGLAVVIAVVGNLAAARLGGFGFETPLAAAMPGIGWLLSVLVLVGGLPGLPSHAQDVLLPGSLPVDPGVVAVGLGWVGGGAVAALLGVLWVAHRVRPLAAPSA